MPARTTLALCLLAVLGAAVAQASPDGPPAHPAPSLAVGDQVGHAFELVLERVTLPRNGYVAVYGYDTRGRLVGRTPLGTLALEAGTHSDVTVGLRLASLTRYGYDRASRPVLVRLHEDDGDGRFFYRVAGQGDVPMTVAGGPIERTRNYRQGAVVQAIDQTLSNGALSVTSAFLPADAFLVVRATGTDGAVDSRATLGAVLVPAGQHRYVRVGLDAAELRRSGYDTTPRAVALTVHPDDGDGVYREGDGVDAPVMQGDHALMLRPRVALPEDGVPSIAAGGALTLELGAEGMSVRLTDVTLTQTSFIVLHAVDAAGTVIDSPALGRSGRRSAGHHRRVVIHIAESQAPVLGDRVVVMIHLDDGDGRYRFPASDPAAEVGGVALTYPMTLR